MSWGWDELPETDLEPSRGPRAPGYEKLRNPNLHELASKQWSTSRARGTARSAMKGRKAISLKGDGRC